MIVFSADRPCLQWLFSLVIGVDAPLTQFATLIHNPYTDHRTLGFVFF